ncbi:MAG: hypothetical protein ACFFCW_40130 [Candidatus Hodarchaeota archaeon]
MYFDDFSTEDLPEDPREAIVLVCSKVVDRIELCPEESHRQYDCALEGYAIVETLLNATNITNDRVQILGNKIQDLNNIKYLLSRLINELQSDINRETFDKYRSTYAMKFGTEFHYEFSEGDLEKIQGLLNQLRNLISETKELGEDHRSRLLKRLEKLQSELHKRVSTLDGFWGFFIDASIVVGLMGENAKPMIEVIQKIVKIIWPTQTRAYELPSDLPFKLLGQAEDDKTKGEKS